jgi:hypothetical protein
MKSILLCISIFSLFHLDAQVNEKFDSPTFFQIQKIGTTYTVDELTSALEKVEFCGMINPNQSYSITLDDAAEIKILSFDEMPNGTISLGCIRQKDLLNTYTWKIQNGILMCFTEPTYKK